MPTFCQSGSKNKLFGSGSIERDQLKSSLFGSGSLEREKVNLPWLIQSKKLGEYVRNSSSSRVFQVFLKDASEVEID